MRDEPAGGLEVLLQERGLAVRILTQKRHEPASFQAPELLTLDRIPGAVLNVVSRLGSFWQSHGPIYGEWKVVGRAALGDFER